MKKLVEFSSGVMWVSFTCAALLGTTGCAWNWRVTGDTGSSAKIVSLKGAARDVGAKRFGRPLAVGDTLKPGTIIQTADRSELELALSRETRSSKPAAQRNRVRMAENSLLVIQKLTRSQSSTGLVEVTHLHLRAGNIHGVVPKLSRGSNYEVQLPTGVAGTRGAVYDLSAEGVVKVFSGCVVLGYVRPDNSIETQVIADVQQFDSRNRALTSLAESGKTTLAAGGP